MKIYEILRERSSQSQAVKMTDLVQASGIPKRKVQVIVAQLESAEIIKRRRDGIRKLRDFQSEDDLSQFLVEYEQRGMSDRERLQQMMSYAESTVCRMRFLKDYFGEENGEDCGHCDNCEARAEGRIKLTETIATPVSPEVPDAPAPPDFLRQPAHPLFNIGDHVHHGKFGLGEVIEISGDNITTRFARGGTKRVRAEFLKAA